MLKHLLILLLLIPFIGTAQIDTTKVEDILIDPVEQMPEFEGGQEGLFNFIGKNVEYPQEAKAKGIQGRVFVSFMIRDDGSIDSIKILKGVHELLDNESLRVIRLMPKWHPGMQKGKPVNVYYNLPINFKLDLGERINKYRKNGKKGMEVKNYKSAIFNFTKIIKDYPFDTEALFLRGKSYHLFGENGKALEDLYLAKQFGSKEAEEYLKMIE